MLAKDPEDRFASCGDFVRALNRSGSSRSAAPATLADDDTAPFGAPRQACRTDPVLHLPGKVILDGFTYGKLLGQTPLGEIWQTQDASGETRWAYHLQGFAREEAADQEQALTYLQKLRHAALLRFKVGEVAPHRIILIFEPWGPSLGERCRGGKLQDEDLLRALAEAAHAVDELTALTNVEHLALGPDTIVQGLDGQQLRDFGLISLLWKSGEEPLEGVNPRYGAPELARGRSSPASDQYSLAVVYADLRTWQLTGKMWPSPRQGSKSRPATVDLADIPIAERQVLRKALDADPLQRYGTCAELIEALAAARGGAASQTTTSVRSALAATQQSFLATVDEWITQQHDDSLADAAAAVAEDGSLRHAAMIEIVPGTAKLRLDVFKEEWHAQRVQTTENEFRFFVPLERSFWQRLRGKLVGVNVHVVLQAVEADARKRYRATVTIAPHHCDSVATRRVADTLVPALLRSVLKALNFVGERRAEKRLPCAANITIRHRAPGGQPTEHHGEVVNISRSGIGFVTTAPLEPGAEIRVFLALPEDNTPAPAVLLKARVKRCERLSNGQHETGAEFLCEPSKPD